jgi:hypothetical protein
MRSIQFVENGKGQKEPRELRHGMSLRNAAGDINDTGTGFQIAIDTLTFIKKQTVEQKFYEVEGGLAKYVPLEVGDGAFSQSILTNLEYSSGGDFETGIINTGSANDRLAQADAAVSSKTVQVANWAKGIGYSLFEIEQALMSNNWDPVIAKERARKKNWDLGLQALTFMGLKSNPTAFPGLLTSPTINVNNTLIQEPISTMNALELNAFVAGLISAYFTNSNKTARPDRFLIPYSDFFGLQTMTPNVIGAGEGNYPISRLEFLLRAFRLASQNPNFEILPLAYCDADTNSAWGVDKQIYLLYRYDRDSVRMDLPVDYTVTQANTMNNFQFQSAAYGQFTGVHFYRELEGLLFEYTPGS